MVNSKDDKFLDMPDKYNIHEQWTLFLDRVELDEERMPDDQIKMMKQAFFGGFGNMLIMLQDDIIEEEDEKAFDILEYMFKQVYDFWQEQAFKFKNF